jgi:hypothetical protein
VSLGFDRREIPAAALDAERRNGVAERIVQDGLDRRVSAAVQDELRIGAEEPR